MDIFTKRLKEERKAKGYTQENMADLLGIPRGTYKNYENFASNHTEPSLETLVKIADILEVTTDYLLGRTDI